MALPIPVPAQGGLGSKAAAVLQIVLGQPHQPRAGLGGDAVRHAVDQLHPSRRGLERLEAEEADHPVDVDEEDGSMERC